MNCQLAISVFYFAFGACDALAFSRSRYIALLSADVQRGKGCTSRPYSALDCKSARSRSRLNYSEATSNVGDLNDEIRKVWRNVVNELEDTAESKDHQSECTVDTIVDVTTNEYSSESTRSDNHELDNNELMSDDSSLINSDFHNYQQISIEHRIQSSSSFNEAETVNDWTYNSADDTVDDIDCRWSSSTERRKQRIKSLNSFNKANEKTNQEPQILQKPQIHTGQSPPKLNLPYNDPSQLQAIQSNAPAILLSSGPGTGKSHVLSLRIAYLLRMQLDYETGTNNINQSGSIQSTPDSMVILSFTNRDAERLKSNALDYLFPPAHNELMKLSQATRNWREQTSKQLWSGTVHVFALAILRKYGYTSTTPLKVLPARAMRNRVSQCLRNLINRENDNNVTMNENELNALRTRHLKALSDVGQSRSILFQNIVRCIDLWKEALLIPSSVDVKCDELVVESQQVDRQKEMKLRHNCVELAMRLGIPESSALLALDVFPNYQARHAAAGTADPSDLAGMAYRLLLANTEALYLIRSKLKHIIVDEYQDISVSQHALLRLVVRGKTDEDCNYSDLSTVGRKNATQRRSPVLIDTSSTARKATMKKEPANSALLNQNYNVPHLFAAGDTKQSIYGWRAAAPSLTVDGFRRDYPQGVVASLSTCYRLPKGILEASSMLLDNTEEYRTAAYDVSPAAANKVAALIDIKYRSDSNCHKSDGYIGESLLLSKGLQKLDSTVLIHGLWDSREENKYIAATIRRRSKERRKALINAMNELDTDIVLDKYQLDITDVAVMVRSSNQLELLKETLRSYGIPFTVAGEDNDAMGSQEENSALPERKSVASTDTIPMKPAILMTMHRSKGEEFDDVYLAGWSEGSFPHPDAVTENLIHEERRLGYVALTRARQRVVITHSLMSRTLHYTANGSKKYVTSQVQPSRFLYELVPSKKKVDGVLDYTSHEDENFFIDNPETVWNRNAGIKEYIAGQNVPEFFQKSYRQPPNSVQKRADLRLHTSINIKSNRELTQSETKQKKVDFETKIEHFKTGETVVVINKKHKQYGKIGIVTKVSKCFVYFSENETNQTVKIKPLFLHLSSSKGKDLGTAACLTTEENHKQIQTDAISRDETERLRTRLKKLTVVQIKSRLKKLKLPVSGRKSELINRLLGM